MTSNLFPSWCVKSVTFEPLDSDFIVAALETGTGVCVGEAGGERKASIGEDIMFLFFVFYFEPLNMMVSFTLYQEQTGLYRVRRFDGVRRCCSPIGLVGMVAGPVAGPVVGG